MSHIFSLPRSFKRKTELHLCVDLFSGYLIAKATLTTLLRRQQRFTNNVCYGGLVRSNLYVMIESLGFMSNFIDHYKIVVKKQRITMAYRPQSNWTMKQMVQILTRADKIDVMDEKQKDWNDDECVKRLNFAINTAQDRIRGDTSFYLIHGWDPRSTLESTLPQGRKKW